MGKKKYLRSNSSLWSQARVNFPASAFGAGEQLCLQEGSDLPCSSMYAQYLAGHVLNRYLWATRRLMAWGSEYQPRWFQYSPPMPMGTRALGRQHINVCGCQRGQKRIIVPLWSTSQGGCKDKAREVKRVLKTTWCCAKWDEKEGRGEGREQV